MGNVIVGQSGGPTAVINASLAGVYAMAKSMGAEKVYGMRYGIQGLLDKQYVDLDTVIHSQMDLELLKKTPSSFLGSCRYKLPEIAENKKVYEKIFAILEKLNIKAFVYIGGNDSMDTIKKLGDYAEETGSDIKFVGAPKTVDNDLPETDHTPGFGSAAKYIASSMKEVIRDAMVYSAKKSILIVEIMGRNAGWLTAASVLCRGEDCPGPDMIYLPEAAFDLDAFCVKVQEKLQQKDNLIIAVSEGIHTSGGTYVCELDSADKTIDAFGHKQMGGTAVFLAEFCARKFGIKARAIELSTLQRCASHISSLTDVEEAFSTGGAAVKAALEGENGKMAILKRESSRPYRCRIETADIHNIANMEKCVPTEWITEEGSNISDEFIVYARPLIMGENRPVMVDGLPRHLVIQ